MGTPNPKNRIEKIVEFVKSIFSKNPIKSITSNKTSAPPRLLPLITSAEENIKFFHDTVRQKVNSFVENDLPKLQNQSKEEITKTAVILTEYCNTLQTNSDEMLKYISQLKSQLQSKIMTSEEVKSTVTYFEGKMAQIKTMTDELHSKVPKPETEHFMKELKVMVDQNNVKMQMAVNAFLQSLWKTVVTIEDMYKKLINEKSAVAESAKASKLSNWAAAFQRNPFKSNAIGADKKEAMPETAGGKSVIPVHVREKVRSLKLWKYFNLETTQGRANVAKATYAGVALLALYFYFKPSKKAAPVKTE